MFVIMALLNAVTLASESLKLDRTSLRMASLCGRSASRVSCVSVDVVFLFSARLLRLSIIFNPATLYI